MKNLLVICLLLLTVTAFAQNRETRAMDPFHQLEIGGSFDVVIEKGSSHAVTIEAKGIETDKITTEVKGGVLKVALKKGNYKNINTTVYITYEALDAISKGGSGNLLCQSDLAADNFKLNNSGSGNLQVKGRIQASQLNFSLSGSGNAMLAGVNADAFNLNMSGSGNMEVASGRARELQIHKSGSGDIQAYDLESDICAIHASGSGNMAVTVNESLQGVISGSGNINYRGNATVTSIKTSGSAAISKR